MLISSFKQFDESKRHSKNNWPNSKWNQISRMYILKTICIKTVKPNYHWVLYLQFMALKGLVSVSISLNFFVMYTWTVVRFLPIRYLKDLVYLFEIYTQNIINFVKLVPLCNQCLHVMLYQGSHYQSPLSPNAKKKCFWPKKNYLVKTSGKKKSAPKNAT